jgi:cytochrome c biogenesis protein CcdA
MVDISQLTLPIVLGSAAIDSINPCAIGVLVLLLAALLKIKDHKSKLLKIASIYIFFVFAIYLVSGLGLIWFQSYLINIGLTRYIGLLIGIFVIVLGIIDVKDFFWYGKGISLKIPQRYVKPLRERINKITAWGAISLGIFAALVELPCTGGPYLAITAILAKQFDLLALVYLIMYNVIFVLPLIVIVALVYFGKGVGDVSKWRKEKRKWMRLAGGLLMIGLGIFLIAFYQFI